jgi:CBS domain-containing protein
MTASELMSRSVAAIHENQPVMEAARKLAALDVGALPIVDDDEHVQGVITDRDIVVKVLAAGRDPESTRVGELADGAVTVEADADVDQVVDVMKQHAVRRLPVVKEGRLVGVISQADVARHLGAKDTGRLVEVISATPPN